MCVQANKLIESSQWAAFLYGAAHRNVLRTVILLTIKLVLHINTFSLPLYALAIMHVSVLYDLQAGSELSGAFANFHEDLFHCRQRQTETGEPQTVPLTCVYVCVHVHMCL